MMGSWDITGWGWVWMTLMMGGGALLLVLLVVVLVRGTAPGPPEEPQDVLARRFAQGEIDEAEYQRRLAVLRSATPGTSAHAVTGGDTRAGTPGPAGGRRAMATIAMVPEAAATGQVKEIDADIKATLGIAFVPNLSRVMAPQPAFLAANRAKTMAVMVAEGKLDRLTKEVIAVAVSAVNNCVS